ncbi:hypothetical protein GQ55_1G412900 [Panicum hallii var. hallii]|uniref:Uncharacterized protein n=2 Tax=Panicum hallii TaxID=206008 RepID=A0A2T7FCW3_9POAL|nr:uncharacterized protein LOC112878835 isoform X2 [Panicum hallii]PAN08577.1 hypothetical protein PAHAL_1G421800 [Panicum hallii]PUZ77929.1 hypothetical protein GQ55_1G412900 [Panicum hallii var. hallii]
MEPASPSAASPPAEEEAAAVARRRLPEELKLRRRTLETVLEQCQRALEMIREVDLEEIEEGANSKEGLQEDGGGEADGNGGGDEGAPPPPPSDADYETDELCDLLQSRVQSPEFLEKLDSIQKSVYQHGADETVSWDIVSAADIWDDKSMNVSDDSEDGYVLVKQEDIVDGIACFMAAYLLSLKQTKDLTPDQLQQALSKTFSAKKRKGKLQKAWDGTKVIYNVASWSATAVGIYQNPAIVQAATTAFWTSCRVISKFL